MKLRLLHENASKPGVFDYHPIAKEMWADRFQEAKKKFNISFNLENDDEISDRVIKIDKDPRPCRFACELRFGGGDWEFSSAYFRCQLKDGSYHDADDNYLSKYNDSSFFIVIPGKDDGNGHFVKSDKGVWGSPGNNDVSDVERPSERKAWKFLNDYLQDLVKQ